jgi:hypothetical protein
MVSTQQKKKFYISLPKKKALKVSDIYWRPLNTSISHVIIRRYVKVKLSLCYFKLCHADSTVLGLVTSCRGAVSYTLLQLYPPPKEERRYPLDIEWLGPRVFLNVVEKRKILHCWDSNPGSPARSPSLYRLKFSGSKESVLHLQKLYYWIVFIFPIQWEIYPVYE